MLTLLTVVRNEQSRILGFLQHHAELVDAFVVVDDNSSDDTPKLVSEFASRMRARGKKFIFQRSRTTGGFCEIYLEQARRQVSTEWVLRLDADEMVPLESQTLLRSTINETSSDVFRLLRLNFLDGEPFKGVESESKPRLFRRDAVTYSQRLHTEEVPLDSSVVVVTLEGAIIQHEKTTRDQAGANRRYRSVIESRLVKGESLYGEMSSWYAPSESAMVGISLLTCNLFEKYTKPLIDSLRRNTLQPFKLCILDNGSTDETVEFLTSAQDFGPACQGYKILYRDENIGIIRGRNETFRSLLQDPSLESICILHNDMLLQPPLVETFAGPDELDWLGILWGYLRQHPEIGVIGTWVTEESLDTFGGVEGFERWSVSQQYPHSYEKANIQPCLYRRSVLDTVGLYDEGFPGKQGYEDWAYNNCVVDAGWDVCATKEVWTWHKGCGTISALVDADADIQANSEYYAKKWGQRRW